MNNAPGKGLLKVSGILFIVFGGISLLLGILAIAGLMMPGGAQMVEQTTGVSATTAIIGAILIVVIAAVNITAGILGVKNANKPEKAQICFIVAVVLLVIIIVNSVISVITGQFSIVTIVIQFVLPVLYLLGAIKNKEVAGNVTNAVDSNDYNA